MARPRVFVSSTFYDLRQVRAVLELFLRQQGFDPVLHDRGAVPYGSTTSPEQAAYREIESCDIVVAIIGGRFGALSNDGTHSISQRELKTAHEKGKQIYIFVEQVVYTNYDLYQINKGVAGIQYSAGSPEIFEFLDEVHKLPINNAVAPFTVAADITDFLREQWAGLFHQLLQDSAKQGEHKAMEDFRTAASTLQQLVKFLTEERKSTSTAIQEIILTGHPIFGDLQVKIPIRHRVFFTNYAELSDLLKAYKFEFEYDPFVDDGVPTDKTWQRILASGQSQTLVIAKEVFDAEGRLRPYSPDEWQSDWVFLRKLAAKRVPSADEYDPFKDD